MQSLKDGSEDDLRRELMSSFLLYVRTFYPIMTGRDFLIPNPPGRESHVITITNALTDVVSGKLLDLLINVPPGHFKSTLVSMFISWAFTIYPDSQFIYTSYSKSLAAKHTEFIKRIMMSRHYQEVFGVTIRHDSKAKDAFTTNFGGEVRAFGSAGSITGNNVGLPNVDRFSGALIIDDPHKPDEVFSDTMREGVINNYKETMLQRPRGPNVPIIFIGQRLHEDDLAAHMLSKESERKFYPIIIKAIDESGNPLCPEVITLDALKIKQELNAYTFSSQYQQTPQPSGGALFKEKDFIILNDEPNILCTFITADTAETSKSYNDASVFSFFGLYEIEEFGVKTGKYGLHWIDCLETRIEPKELKDTFLSFYSDCCLHKIRPNIAAIEKKSTGVTLISVLEEMRGLEIREVKRTRASGSKADRFLELQPIVAAKLITFTQGAKHTSMCINQAIKITANDTHRWDDIIDTLYDAVKIALIDKTIYVNNEASKTKDVVNKLSLDLNKKIRASNNIGEIYGRYR